MEILEEDGVSQLSLKWKSDDFSKIESKHCVRCNTTELNEKLKDLVKNLVSGKKFEKNFVKEKEHKGVLFLRSVNGEFRWYEEGDEDRDGKYEGEILNGIPSSEGELTWPDGEKYTGEWKDGRQNGQGILTFFSGNKYEGKFKDGKYHGRGIFTWSDSDKYEGEFKDGEKHGYGIYIQTDGSKYVGEFKDGLKNGQGTLTYGKGEFEGDLYVGEFKDGKKHGHGIYTLTDGSNYVGKFKNGLKYGQGILTYGKGELESNKYEGVFKNDKKHGKGVYTSSNGDEYSGEFRNGLKNGQGTLTYGKGELEGDMYEGEFKDDRKHGQGKYTYANEDIYLGEFKNDKKNGQGTFTWNNGDKYVGNYDNGERNGEGTQTYFDGRKYVGEWTDGEFNGSGKFISLGGESYDGQWQDGKYNGQGTYIFGEGKWKGDKYQGEYKNGKREGQGTYTFSDGKKYSGNFKNGNLHGQGILTLAEGDRYEGEWNDGNYWNIKSYEKDGTLTGEYVNGVKQEWLDTVNKCQDLNTHTYCTSFQAPAPTVLSQPWGEISAYSLEVFCASDLSASICDEITTALLAATTEWGNYGPLEYWVVGTEVEATQNITKVNCERRAARNQWKISADYCSKRSDRINFGEVKEQSDRFEEMRKIGAEAVASGKPKHNAGRNGHRSWNIHFFTSSLPVGLTDKFKVPGAEEQKTIFHEYFHAVQHSHILTTNHHKRFEELLKPVWFDEGGAEYMAYVGLTNVFQSGVLQQARMEGKNPFYPLEKMKRKIKRGKIGLNSVCPGVSLKDIDYDNSCANVAYDIGTWAHAYLANKFGPNILLDTFYPNLEKWGWEGAFERTYGMSSEDFYKEFDKFLNLPLEEQLSILPKSFQDN